MDLPIDARKAPFKEKYLDEETPMLARWFVFGEHPDGRVDVAAPEGDVFTALMPAQAQRLVAARDYFITTMIHILNESPILPDDRKTP